ncbi:MAG: SDR family NAD(P)-dependent oxidoreductase, partial [Bacteroidota bacterium]
MKLNGQIAVVTGGGRGIGRGIALALAAEGAHVVVCARTNQEIESVAEEIRAKGGSASAVPTDVG